MTEKAKTVKALAIISQEVIHRFDGHIVEFPVFIQEDEANELGLEYAKSMARELGVKTKLNKDNPEYQIEAFTWTSCVRLAESELMNINVTWVDH